MAECDEALEEQLSCDLCVYRMCLGHHYSFKNFISFHPRPLRFGRGTVKVYLEKSMDQFFEVCI